MIRTNQLLSLLAIAALLAPSAAAIVVDGEFSDWEFSDLVIMDEYWGMSLGETPSYEPCYPIDGGQVPPGTDATYLFDDSYDDSRDLIAFYFREEGDSLFFRVDLFDLKLFAENSGGLDLYIILDLDNSEGETWLPDYTDCQTDLPWDLAVCVYETAINSIKEGTAGQPELTSYINVAFNAEQDSVELEIPRQMALDHGWDGANPFKLQVFTTRDGTNDGPGEIGAQGPGAGNSDLTDAFMDDDRGFSDGFLNGYFTSADRFSGRAKWAVMMHGNQSFNNEDSIRARIDKSRDPDNPVLGVGLYRAIETAELTGQPVELHLSGCLTNAIQWADPDFNDRIRAAVQNDLVHLTGGVYSEHIMPFFNGEVNQQSIRLGTETIQKVYGLSPSDLKVFWIPERIARGDFYQDILAANDRFNYSYEAVILDEVTHHHDWFGYDKVWNDIEGDDELVDTDNDVHKIHEYQGLKIFFIDRYAQKWKTETMYPTFYDCSYEKSLQIGVRAKLLDLAMAADQSQVLLCMEDWEDFAGEPYRLPANPRNPNGHETVTRWIASHPWIHMTTTTSILNGDVDTDGDGSGDLWDTVTDTPLTDHLPPHYGLPMPPYWITGELPINSYAWVRDSSEGNAGDDNPYPDPANVDNNARNDDWDDGYQNWYYGSDHEFSFFQMVPALKGWQYDRSDAGSYPAVPLPNSKPVAGLWQWDNGTEIPQTSGIIPETWSRFPTVTQGYSTPMWEYACLSFMNGLYETAWHDERTVRFYTEDEEDDDSRGIVVDWVLPACNHLRDVNIIIDAIAWSEQPFSETATVSEFTDVDMDGEDELILRNNRVFLVFENDGGRLVKAYSRTAAAGSLTELVGTSVTHPDRESEDENLDAWISIDPDSSLNRVSCFRDGEYVNGEYLLSTKRQGAVFYSPDLKIRREIILPDDSDELEISYELDPALEPLNVEFGFSPNPFDTMYRGKSALESIGGPHSTVMGLKNSSIGTAYIRFGDTDYVIADDLSRDRTCALTQRIVISVDDGDTFHIGFGDGYARHPPGINLVTVSPNPLNSSSAATLTVNAWVEGAADTVELFYSGTAAVPSAPIKISNLFDDGLHGDGEALDGRWGFELDLPAGILPAERFLLSVSASSSIGSSQFTWPFFRVTTGSGRYGDPVPELDRYLSILDRAGTIQPCGKHHVSGGHLGFNPPVVAAGTFYSNDVTDQGGTMQLYVIVQDADGLEDIEQVRLLYYGINLGLQFDDLGNGIFGLEYDWPGGIPAGNYVLEVEAVDASGNISNRWPYWEIR